MLVKLVSFVFLFPYTIDDHLLSVRKVHGRQLVGTFRAEIHHLTYIRLEAHATAYVTKIWAVRLCEDAKFFILSRQS